MSGRRGRRKAHAVMLPYGSSVLCTCGHSFAVHGRAAPHACAWNTSVTGYRCPCTAFGKLRP